MPSDHDKIESLIRSLAKINVPDPADDVIVPNHSTGYEGSGPDRRQIFEQQNKLTESLEKFIAFDPLADALFPGALVQGSSLERGDLVPIRTDRTPLTITVTGLVSDDPTVSFSKRLNDPTNATVVDAVSQILSQHLNAEQPARVTYTKIEVHSVEEAFLRLDASYKWISGHVSGSFQSSASTVTNRFMVRFVQSYYTVSSEPQSSPASFVSGKAKYADFAHYVGAGNPPTYVASVTFGRELWMLIESNSTSSDVQATLDAAFMGGSASLSAKQRQLLEESSMQVLVIGGGGTPAVKVITGDKVGAIAAFLTAGANYSKQSPGAVISYVIRYMVDNSIARVSSSADYTIRTSVAAPENTLTDVLFTIKTGDDDKDDDNHVSIQFTLQPANVVLYRDPDIAPKQPNDHDPTWHDHDRRPVNFRVSYPVVESNPNARYIDVAIEKSGGAHWHFGFDFLVKFADGRTVAVGSHGENDHNFGDNYNSDRWRFSIPWARSSREFLDRRLTHVLEREDRERADTGTLRGNADVADTSPTNGREVPALAHRAADVQEA